MNAATFRQAAQLIRTGGLVQGNFELEDAHCTVGALMAAKGIDVDEEWLDTHGVREEVNHLVNLLGGLDEYDVSGLRTVTRWNDTIGRTVDDVITLLERAAEKLEANL